MLVLRPGSVGDDLDAVTPMPTGAFAEVRDALEARSRSRSRSCSTRGICSGRAIVTGAARPIPLAHL
jgi:hypothetical protein